MAARALVIDLDGTVWDSRPWLARIIGGGRGEAEATALAALRNGGAAATLLRAAGVTPASFAKVCGVASDLDLYPGVATTLRALHARVVPLGVVTNLPAWMAEPMLACSGIDGFFDSLVGWGRTRAHKPNPAPILASLADLEIEPTRDVWYVGDGTSDAEAAARARISFAWASYGYGTSRPAETDVAIAAFIEVAAL
jgi:phosphoglycolate phosphatase